ncbi:MAG: formate/nitrite transporter family protein [Lachnospiraceae bacterium]|nr:formate/nitrite transporter family protein [Candidatus Colinaster scatohippi]
MKEAIYTYKNGCKGKCTMSAGLTLGKSFFAGLMIGLGAAGSSVAAHNIANVGLARFIAAVVFPVGLMMVILMGAELFTGDCLLAIGLPEKDITIWQFVRTLVLVYLGNLVGGVILSALIVMSGQLDYSGGMLGAYTIKVALGKVGLTPMKAISSGILCNILVCAAVIMAVCAKDVTGKLLVSFFVIMLFVTAGYEHCVANMYYITAGLMAKANPSYVAAAMEAYGLSAEQLDLLNVKNMIVNNLIPVTIGNIIGGSCFVGLPFYFFNKNKA